MHRGYTENALAAAREALAVHDAREALLSLLKAWQETRSPRLARLVERVGERLHRWPITADHPDHLLLAWMFVERQRDPAQLDALLAQLHHGRISDVRERLLRLQDWPPDPRIARQVSHLKASLQPHFPDEHALWRLADQLIDTGPTLPLSMGAQELCRAIEASLSPFDEGQARRESLLMQVWNAPHDAEARQVWADQLLERDPDDPLAEFVQLQCTPDATPQMKQRAADLQAAHQLTWLGPLARVMAPASVVFEGGFPVRAAVRCGDWRLRAYLVGHPGWSTFQHLELFGADDERPLELALHPVMRGLRSLHGVPGPMLERVSAVPWTHLEELGIDADAKAAAHHLKRWRPPPGLKRLVVRGRLDALGDWWDAVRHLPLDFAMKDDGTWVNASNDWETLVVDFTSDRRHRAGRLTDLFTALGDLPRGRLGSLRLKLEIP